MVISIERGTIEEVVESRNSISEGLGTETDSRISWDWYDVDKHPRLGIFIPVHNEAGGLDVFLNELWNDVPRNVNIDLVFYCNGCDDGSEQIIKDWLAEKGYVRVDIQEIESHNTTAPSQVSRFNIPLGVDNNVSNETIIHLVETPVPSKAEGVNFANGYLKEMGIEVVVGLDADIILEDHSLEKMFKEAVVSGADLVTIADMHIVSRSLLLSIAGMSLKSGAKHYPIRVHGVPGCFFGWNIEKFSALFPEGIPGMVREDYLVELAYRLAGYQIEEIAETGVWVMSPNRFEIWNHFRMIRRMMLGWYQVREYLYGSYVEDEESKRRTDEMLSEDQFGGPIWRRLRDKLTNWNSVLGLTYNLLFIPIMELARLAGYFDYKRDKDLKTWKKTR